MVGALSFSEPYFCIQQLLQSPPKIHSPTSAIFQLPIFAYIHPYNLHQNYFPHLSHLAKSGYVKRPMSK